MSKARADSVSDAGDSFTNGCGPCSSGTSSGSTSPGGGNPTVPPTVTIALADYNELQKELQAGRSEVKSLQRQVKDLKADRDARFDQATLDKSQTALEEWIWEEAEKQFKKELDGLVKSGVKKGLEKETKRLNTLGLSASNSPALSGFCTDCEANKATLQTFKDMYNRLDGVIQRSAGCYRCSEERTSHQESKAHAEEEFTKLNKHNEALLEAGRVVVAERDQLLEEKNHAFSMLSEKHLTLDKLQKQNLQLVGVSNCQNCTKLEQHAQNAESQRLQTEHEARREIVKLTARVHNLQQEGEDLAVRYDYLHELHSRCWTSSNNNQNGGQQTNHGQNNYNNGCGCQGNYHNCTNYQGNNYQPGNRNNNQGPHGNGNRRGNNGRP